MWNSFTKSLQEQAASVQAHATNVVRETGLDNTLVCHLCNTPKSLESSGLLSCMLESQCACNLTPATQCRNAAGPCHQRCCKQCHHARTKSACTCKAASASECRPERCVVRS